MTMYKHLIVISLTCLASACASNVQINQPDKSKTEFMAKKPYNAIYHHVEFKFDSVEPERRELMQKTLKHHIDHLTSNPSHTVLLQGAGDDAGSFNYNYTLGLERASFIKEYLLNNGVDVSQIKVSSASKANSNLKSYARTVHLAY